MGLILFGFEIRLGHKQTQQTPKKLERWMRICLMGAMGFFRGYSEARWKAIWVLLRLLGVEYGLFKMKEMAIWRLYEHNDQSWRVLDLNCGTMIIEKWSLLFEDLHKNITFHENWPKRGIMRNCLKFLLSLKYELPNYCCQLKDQNSEQAVGY